MSLNVWRALLASVVRVIEPGDRVMTKPSSLRAAVVLAALTPAGLALSSAPCAKAQTRHDFQIWNAVFFTGQALRADKGPVFWFDAQGVWEQATFTYKRAGHFEIPALS